MFILGVTLISINHIPVSSVEPIGKRLRNSLFLGVFSVVFFFLLPTFLWEKRGLSCLLYPLGHILLLMLSNETFALLCPLTVFLFYSSFSRLDKPKGNEGEGSALKIEQIFSEDHSQTYKADVLMYN